MFYVDHIALVHLVNKPHVSGRIARWLLFFLEYDFTVVYKLGKSRTVADGLTRLAQSVQAVGVPDQST